MKTMLSSPMLSASDRYYVVRHVAPITTKARNILDFQQHVAMLMKNNYNILPVVFTAHRKNHTMIQID